MRPYRSHLLRHSNSNWLRPPSSHPTNILLARSIPSVHSLQARRHKVDTSSPPQDRLVSQPTRFTQYEKFAAEDAQRRSSSTATPNPLNYVDAEKSRSRNNEYYKRRMKLAGVGLVATLAFQAWMIWTYAPSSDSSAQESNKTLEEDLTDVVPEKLAIGGDGRWGRHTEKLDSPNDSMGVSDSQAGSMPVKIIQKPGQPEVKLDAAGNELIDTGTSTIPHFPRLIKIPSSSAFPASVPTSTMPGQGAESGNEEYHLLGVGIRTVSFLSIQVYVLGLYVRASDLPKLQSAFVRHVNPLGSSLIPQEKDQLRKILLDDTQSLDIWDKILRENDIRSAVRIVPTRGTDFQHLRDGWVRGITSRTQELAKQATGKEKEYEDDSFGTSMQEFKQLLGGKGKAPKGSTVLLLRDEKGALSLMFENEKKDEEEKGIYKTQAPAQVMGRLEDERVSRQVWLGYLGGKNVSSEGARKNIVEGVMELVERPVGTVGTQVS